MFDPPPTSSSQQNRLKRQGPRGEGRPARRRKVAEPKQPVDIADACLEVLSSSETGDDNDDVLDAHALDNLYQFGRDFYNADTVSVLKAAVDFVAEFADGGEPDNATATSLALWINMKLGRFRGLVISDDLPAAMQVRSEFTMADPSLAGFLHDIQAGKLEALKALVGSKQSVPSNGSRYSGNNNSGSKVPQSVSRTLPRQGSLQVCLRYLSNFGCNAVATALGVAVPPEHGMLESTDIDDTLVEFHSQLTLASKLCLADYVRLVRGQTDTDSRPNKDLYELPQPKNPKLHEIWRRWNEKVKYGVTPEWLPTRPQRQNQRPRNHSSICQHLHQVRRHIRKGQREGRYIVVNVALLDQWQDVYISPVGVVDKDSTDVRLIDDYSYPDGESINNFTDRTNLPAISYNPPGDIARRIVTLRRESPRTNSTNARGSARRYERFELSREALDDLRWFCYILQHQERFNSIPVAQFAGESNSRVFVHMDASDEGLCAIEPTLKQFLRLKFSEEAKTQFRADKATNSINVRQMQSAILAALVWGPVWAQRFGPGTTTICFLIDNASAVAWTQRRLSRQPTAQT
ncbi:unnamed protein product [Phytophthora lilii]|uniref:Unnamed protein product n=1 Tax=Phytophthora lilii TaxID=2077276 RepID=A0A9W6TIH5_9STRA|nr:unnamed protein product [Phytophthora lilii]